LLSLRLVIRRVSLSVLLVLALGGCASTFYAAAAVVNGVKITPAELNDQVDRQVQASGGQAGDRRAVELQVLRGLINQAIVGQEADARGIAPTEEEVDASLQEQLGGARIEDIIAQTGLTEEEIREIIYQGVQFEQLLASVAPEVTDEEVQQAFDADPGRFTRVKARHIQVTVDDKTTQAEARAEAGTIARRLQGGADFSALAKQRSDDEQFARPNGQFPGFIAVSDFVGVFGEEFGEALSTAKLNRPTDPVRTAFGFSVIVVTARQSDPYARAAETLRGELSDQAGQQATQQLLADAANRAKVVVNPKYGDWDPSQLDIVPHQFYTPADEPEVPDLSGIL